MAIKLTSKNKARNVDFYFNNIKDCEIFKSVFKDHWCNVTWEEPVEVNSVPYEKSEYINDDPKKRAEDNLKWGFNSIWASEVDGELTEDQQSFVNSMTRILSGIGGE